MPELVKDDASDPASMSFDWPEGELEPALYGYDVWNNMVTAHNAEGEHLYSYNGDGLRVSQKGHKIIMQLVKFVAKPI